jgi:hypothetical protein
VPDSAWKYTWAKFGKRPILLMGRSNIVWIDSSVKNIGWFWRNIPTMFAWSAGSYILCFTFLGTCITNNKHCKLRILRPGNTWWHWPLRQFGPHWRVVRGRGSANRCGEPHSQLITCSRLSLPGFWTLSRRWLQPFACQFNICTGTHSASGAAHHQSHTPPWNFRRKDGRGYTTF